MAIYSYDDFLNAVGNANGKVKRENFSEADWRMAESDPDFGMSLYQYKNDYANAATAAQRKQANQRAEALRSQYGHYTAGQDGSGYYRDKPSPGSFEAQGERPSFSYDLESDPVYSAYRKQYAREGQRAAQDALGSAAAATGGIPSSYAVTAASQAGDYYASQMADKVPELYQQAYNRYLNDLSQYNTDRSFQYGQYVDEVNSQTADRQEALQNALLGAQYAGDYSGLQKLGYDVSNAPAEYQKKWQQAQLAASMGDYGPMERDFGIRANPYLTNGELLYNLGAYQGGQGSPEFMDQLVRFFSNYLKGYQPPQG